MFTIALWLKMSGANWLSFSEKVRNPYYGSQMLNCGEITGVIEND